MWLIDKIRNAFRSTTRRRLSPRDSGQISINTEITFKPTLKKSRDEIDRCAKAFREISSANLTPEVDAALRVVEEAARDKVYDLPALDLSAPMPSFNDHATVYTSFKPNRIVAVETVVATFSKKGLPDVDVSFDIPSANDLMLTGFFSGALNAFPNAPSSPNGINCAVFAVSAVGVGVDWPKVLAGVPVHASFAILPSLYSRLVAPEGYDKIPRSITVRAFLSLFGPQI